MKFSSNAPCVIGLDLGGTKVLGIVMDRKGIVHHQVKVATPKGGNAAVLNVVFEILDSLLEAAKAMVMEVAGIAIGVPGYVDSSLGIILDASNVDVKNLSLGSRVRERFSLPTLVLHDVKAAALGEAKFGAGVGVPYFAYLNIGTGVSVGLVLDSTVYCGMAGRAGELGHVMMQPGGPLCNCGRRGCLEALASGPALVREAQKVATLMPRSLLAKLAASKRGISAESIAEAAQKDDPGALEVIRTAADYLAQAIAWLVNVLDVQRIVVGGGLAQMGEVLFEPMRTASMLYAIEDYQKSLEVVPSKLGVNTGAVGAAIAMHLELDKYLEAG